MDYQTDIWTNKNLQELQSHCFELIRKIINKTFVKNGKDSTAVYFWIIMESEKAVELNTQYNRYT